MQPLPNQNSPFVQLPNGRIVPPWNSYLQQFTQQPPNIIPITVTASPFSYTAREPGHVVVEGGTVSLVQLTRGSVTVTVLTNIVPVSIGDTVGITYSVLPTIKFIPMYGNVTG